MAIGSFLSLSFFIRPDSEKNANIAIAMTIVRTKITRKDFFRLKVVILPNSSNDIKKAVASEAMAPILKVNIKAMQ